MFVNLALVHCNFDAAFDLEFEGNLDKLQTLLNWNFTNKMLFNLKNKFGHFLRIKRIRYFFLGSFQAFSFLYDIEKLSQGNISSFITINFYLLRQKLRLSIRNFF